jgi:hypothetical protein
VYELVRLCGEESVVELVNGDGEENKAEFGLLEPFVLGLGLGLGPGDADGDPIRENGLLRTDIVAVPKLIPHSTCLQRMYDAH